MICFCGQLKICPGRKVIIQDKIYFWTHFSAGKSLSRIIRHGQVQNMFLASLVNALCLQVSICIHLTRVWASCRERFGVLWVDLCFSMSMKAGCCSQWGVTWPCDGPGLVFCYNFPPIAAVLWGLSLFRHLSVINGEVRTLLEYCPNHLAVYRLLNTKSNNTSLWRGLLNLLRTSYE